MSRPPVPFLVIVALLSTTLAAAPRRAVELADPAHAATPERREDLAYLAQCALPADVELRSGEHVFPGRIGLATGWVGEPLTRSQERWVSACMLAHGNALGKHVTISLRAEPAPVPFLRPDDEERARFPVFEGGFFGDMFSKEPVGYACSGSPEVHRDRVCTEPSGETTEDGKPLTRCGLVLTGPCSDPASFVVNGRRYTEIVYTYLEPGP